MVHQSEEEKFKEDTKEYLPIINSADELYKYYKKNPSKRINYEINKDLLRTDPHHYDFNGLSK